MQEPATHRLLCTFCHTMLYQTLLVLPQAVYCAPWSVPPVTHTVCPFWAIPTIVLSSLVLVRTFVASSTFAHLPAQFSTWDSFSALTAIAVTELWAWAGTARVNVATITAVATAVLDLMQLKNLPMFPLRTTRVVFLDLRATVGVTYPQLAYSARPPVATVPFVV